MIINPELSDEDRSTLLSEIEWELNDLGIKKTSEDVWGKKELAYKINGSYEGYYILYTLENNKDFTEFVKFLNMKKEFVWRHTIVKIDY